LINIIIIGIDFLSLRKIGTQKLMNASKKVIILLGIATFFSLSCFGHNLKGTIVDQTGKPIPYATIYIKEISLGTTTNEDGKFEIDIAPGTYTINFRCLGYKPKTEVIRITKTVESISVVLELQYIEMQEVVVAGNGEDPAYSIMRKVIGLSYVHLNQINSYFANVYIKGTVKFQKVPGLIRNQLRKKNIDVKSGDVFVNETVSEISFKAPNKYTQRIKSINSTFPEVVDFSVGDFLGASLYQDNIQILTTPLNKNAFSYYKFAYEGFDKDKNYTIDKIKVTPKIKSKQLFEGYIYIIEDLWCLHKADLKFQTPFGEVNLKLIYDEISPGVWLPVSHNYTFSGGLLGVKGDARFAASLKYNKVSVNKQVLAMANLPGSAAVRNKTNTAESVTAIPQGKSQKKRASKIEELLDKPQLKNQDVNKLSRLMAKTDKSRKPDSLKTLEINDAVKITTDKGAEKTDSAYWSSLRPIPLSSEEIKSFRGRDSINEIAERNASKNKSALLKHKRNYGLFDPLFFGKRYYLNDSAWTIRYNGLITSKTISFNAADGWNISQNIIFTHTYKPGQSLSLSPYLAYAFNRNALLGTGTLRYTYSPMNRGSFQMSFGRNTTDFNPAQDAINPFINSVASLFFKDNFARYYESRFIKFKNSIDLSNGLVLISEIGWEKAIQLSNSTNFSFFYKNASYASNIPYNDQITESSIEDQSNALAGLKIEYTPRYYYRVREGVKIMSNSDFPTFYIQYKKGLRNFFSSTSDFDFLGAGALYAHEFSPTSSIAYEFHSGWFPNNKRVFFADFAHAPTQKSPVLLKEYRHSFYLPGYYELSTSDKFIRAHLSYKSPYIALKYLPFLSNTLWREMIWTGYYTSPQNKNYLEVGYTLLEVLLSANVGIFAGFNDGHFTGWGINVALRWSD
jgi:hypothetical protein